MDAINAASQFNTSGVEKFHSGDLVGSYGCFRQGVVILAALAGSNHVVDVVTTSDVDVGALDSAPPASLGGRDGITRSTPGPSCSGSLEASQNFFVWKEPLLFRYDPRDPVISSPRVALFATILEFNLAIVYHVRSLQLGGEASREGSARASRAANLYNSCLIHLELAMENDRNIDIIPIANNILIAASNNRALILRQRCLTPTDSDDDEVRQLLNDVVVACDDVMPHINSNPRVVIFDPSELHEFALNQAVYGIIIIAPVA